MVLNTLQEQFRIFTTPAMIYHWRRLIYTGEQLIAGVVAKGGIQKIANISANFHKKSKRPEWETQRLGVN
jgi:hypothetical protein